MWFQRVVEIDDEPDPEPISEPTERLGAVPSSVKTRKSKVFALTPADFQRVRLMSILRVKDQKAKQGPQTPISSLLVHDVNEFLEHEYWNDPMPDLQRKRQLAKGIGLDLATVDVCAGFLSYENQVD